MRGSKCEPIASRFWRRVQVGPDCWEWTGGRNEKGYGLIYVGGGSQERAHRFSYELNVGPVPAGQLVLHHCDNPPCVRPDHLFLGTADDNNKDMWSKGRGKPASGEQAGTAKLTQAHVDEIRRRYKKGAPAADPDSSRALAREFGVGSDQINRIVNRRVWTKSAGVPS